MTTRTIAQILHEICKESNGELTYEDLSNDRIILLQHQGKPCRIYGMKFPHNQNSVGHLLDDKAALSQYMSHFHIPCIAHHFLPLYHFQGENNPDLSDLIQTISSYKIHGEMVIKDNQGTGGNNVFRCTTLTETKDILQSFCKAGILSACISPFIEIQHEWRCIVLNHRVMLVFEKKRPEVIGDGIHTIQELMLLQKQKEPKNGIPDKGRILKKGEQYLLSRKHNLGQGAIPEIVQDPKIIQPLITLTIQCSKALNIGFASVDIIQDQKGDLKILEINSGVMMEHFANTNPEYYQIAKNIYQEAINEYYNFPIKKSKAVQEKET